MKLFATVRNFSYVPLVVATYESGTVAAHRYQYS
jgi:hypothetical protein